MYFRIYNYLKLKIFILAFFIQSQKKVDKLIINKLTSNLKKKFLIFTSYGRVSLILILKYLKHKNSLKNEIIVSPYNLPEVIKVIIKTNFKPVFCDIEYETGFYNLREVEKKISNRTAAILLTNMFNTFDASQKLKKICQNAKVFLIEDNAIFLDNYRQIKKKKYYSGYLGDFTFLSFNIMKNIPAFFGGAVLTNIKDFNDFAISVQKNYNTFSKILLLKQILIYFVIKLFSANILYRLIFFHIIKYSHNYNNHFLISLFYPSLKFKNKKLPKFYFTNISFFQKKLIYLQLKNNQTRINNHNLRKIKNIYYYKKFKSLNNKNIRLINVDDFDFQNFIDFPILVKRRDEMHKYLLKNSIDTRLYYYRNCEYIFEKKIKSLNAMKYENEILCLPNGRQITFTYIDKIIKIINNFSY